MNHINLAEGGERLMCSFYKTHKPYSHKHSWTQSAFPAKQIFSLLRTTHYFIDVYDLLRALFFHCITWKRVKISRILLYDLSFLSLRLPFFKVVPNFNLYNKSLRDHYGETTGMTSCYDAH